MAFCPRCGHKRLGNFRYCTQCNFDFDNPDGEQIAPRPAGGFQPPAAPAVPATPAPMAARAGNQVALLAALAWFTAAAMMAFLAFQQLEAAQALDSVGIAGGDDLKGTAVINGLSAIVTAFFGIKCLQGPDRGFLGTSTAWAIVNVAFGVYQVANGATYWVFYVVLIASGLAGILSWAARASAPAKKA